MDRNNKEIQNMQLHNGKHQCHMAACCTHHQPTIFSQLLNKSHTLLAHLLEKKILKNLGGKGGIKRMDQLTERRQERKSNKSKNNKRCDSKVESNYSPEIPDKRHQISLASLQGFKKENRIKHRNRKQKQQQQQQQRCLETERQIFLIVIQK